MSSGASPVSAHRDGTLLEVIVQPRASRTEITGIHDGSLRLRIAAPPVDGAANEAIVEFLAKSVGVAKGRVEIVGGLTGRRKRVLIRDASEDDVRDMLGIDSL